jgi:hypothetical protein
MVQGGYLKIQCSVLPGFAGEFIKYPNRSLPAAPFFKTDYLAPLFCPNKGAAIVLINDL